MNSELGVSPVPEITQSEAVVVPDVGIKKDKKKPSRKIVFGVAAGLITATAIGYTQKDEYADDLANISRKVIGPNNTARLERAYFYLEDKKNRLIYEITGDEKSPFGKNIEVPNNPVQPDAQDELALINSKPVTLEPPVNLEPPKPAPLILPEIKYLGVPLQEGEGIWRTDGLPRTSPENPLMIKTVVRPDKARPDASVAVLLFDKRRIQLHMIGGTKSPGGDRGIPGPGRIPNENRPNLLAAWNGGFIGWHASFGMYANGKEYRPLRNGLASVAVTRDGVILMGEWGRTLFWNDEMVAVRQNAVLLVENCESSRRIFENNNTWGYIYASSQANVTRRSAIGLTANGDLLVAAGNDVRPDTLAYSLWAAGACTAMQLDINTPQVNTSLYFQNPDGSIRATRFAGADNPRRFLGTEENDFMYVILDEANFKP